ncbi:prenyltransferase/squalene oxidase repeat-containing protein [Streptomyces sp. MST-110588]|uniref:prenyltransferase/squalene oxidase repeat-containing protein n=1 Tax=Streptomyces sp. MST-110588 TaxID=2833628 RepID=UPI001F5CF9A8|nr:prenyltransferase/squalene oxidase repeat-containing protein [Streptomyces sp. MST-110588]
MAPSPAVLARRGAAALATAAVLCAAGAPAASADTPAASASPSPKLPQGLYGSKDPQYDGVWRQSLALLAQHTVGVRPARPAVDWLVGQQCSDGSFAAFRPDPAKACDGKTMRDTNQTAAAVQALAALGGHGDAVGKAVAWLKSVQNDDGSWSSMPGSPGDTNSTSVVIGALAAAGEKPESVTSKKGGKSPYDALVTFQIGCDAKDAEEGQRGAFAFQPKDGKLTANDDATAAAALGGLGKGYVVDPAGKDVEEPVKGLSCEGSDKADKSGKGGKEGAERAAQGAAAYLVSVLDKNDHHLKSAMPGAGDQPDVGNTADAVVALAAGSHGDAAQPPLKWLEKNSAAWAKEGGPAAYAQLVLAAHATGADPRHFGGADLVAQLNATGPEPAGSAEPSATAEKDAKDAKDDEGGIQPWWIAGIVFVASAGVGFLISGRRKKNQH